MTVIHIKDDTKQLLIEFMAEVKQKEKKKVSYDEIIRNLLIRTKGKNKKKLLPLFGSIEKKQAEKDLEELKSLDEKRFKRLSRSGS